MKKEEKFYYQAQKLFDERACNTMINLRNSTLIEGPSVDLDKEAQLIKKYGKK